jgi:hypothetical protein
MLTMNGLMAFDAIADRMTAAFPSKSLYEERFIAETAIASWMKLPILLAMVGSVLLWLAMAGSSLSERWRRVGMPQYVDTVLLSAVILYAILVIIWEPTNREFWIQTYVFATIWCARQLSTLTRVRRAVLAGLVGCLFFANFFAALRPLSDARTDYWRSYNAKAIERRDDVDLIFTSCTWLCMWYLRYFAKAEVISPAMVAPEIVNEVFQRTDPDRVLISSLAYHPHSMAAAHDPRNFEPEWTERFHTVFPPPLPLPDDDTVQEFFRLENGIVTPLN